MKQVGKRGKINLNANKILKEKFIDLGITRCEVSGKNWALNFAHKHKRIFYYSCPELLSSVDEVLVLYQPIHNLIESDKELTMKLFDCLRPVGKEDGRNNARKLICRYLEKIGKYHLINMIL